MSEEGCTRLRDFLVSRNITLYIFSIYSNLHYFKEDPTNRASDPVLMKDRNTVGAHSYFITAFIFTILRREALWNLSRSCVSSFGDAMLNMSRPSNTGHLYYKARNLIYKKTNAEHHKLFFKDCVDKNLIPFGLQFNFHPVACSSINVDLTAFIKHRLKDVSSETFQFLYSKYIVEENIANNKFENWKDYVIGKLPYRISKQILDQVNSSNMRLKKNLLKRRKKKISRLEKLKKKKEKVTS